MWPVGRRCSSDAVPPAGRNKLFPRSPIAHIAAVLTGLGLLHALSARDTEPFFNNDETRHTMTGVFVRDAIFDLPASLKDPKSYAVRYYVQYPALGLMVWPPGFYAVEGSVMAILGTGFSVGRLTVACFALLVVVYSYRLARLRFPHSHALFTAAFVGLSPLVFAFSQVVMLEVPALALGLVALVHFEKYLSDLCGRDAILAGLFAAFCALTRFDGVFLVPYFALRLLGTRQFELLGYRAVIGGILLAVLLAGPYYAFTFREYGGITTAAATGTLPQPMSVAEQIAFYPMCIPEQVGWVGAAAAAAGLVFALMRSEPVGIPAALMLAVYATFAPLAERESRHAIYWVPALALFATHAVASFRGHSRLVSALLILAGVAYAASREPVRYVRGYAEAVRFALDHRETSRPFFVDGELTGSFVYHTRHLDPSRTVWVLRGDKLVYSMLSDPNTGYKQGAANEADVLEILHRYDPEWVLVEDPPTSFNAVPGTELIRRTLRNNSGQYRLEATIPIRSNYERFGNAAVRVYRKLQRNPNATSIIEFEVQGLGKPLGQTKP